MSILPALRKFNTVALAISLVLVILLLLTTLYQASQSHFDDTGLHQDTPSSSISGEMIDAGDRQLTLYRVGDTYEEGPTDLRFVDSRDGATTRFAEDPKQRVFNGQVLGIPRRKMDAKGYGYLGLIQTGDISGKPLFDLVFLRFKDMKRFVVTTGIFASDPVEIDPHSFSSVIWDKAGRGKFILFDIDQGKIVVTRDLDLQGLPQTPASSDAAPKNKFH